METQPLMLPLSAIQHFLFCPRQFALIHIEGQWTENRWTAEGRVLHARAHEGGGERRPGVRISRTLSVASAALGVSGQCDVVEFHDDGTILPVEYKRGKPKAHRADEVQVCAQAMCLEEMMGKPPGFIAKACLYYGERARRTDVALDTELRMLTLQTARAMRACFEAGKTPLVPYEEKRCRACSLLESCRPDLYAARVGVEERFAQALTASVTCARED